MWSPWALALSFLVTVTSPGRAATSWPDRALPCIAAFLQHQGWTTIEIVVNGYLTELETRQLVTFLARHAIFTSAVPLLLSDELAATPRDRPGADTLLVTRSPRLRLTDRWRRHKNRVLVLCLGCTETGFFLRSRFADVFTTSITSRGGVRFFDAKMWNRPRNEVPLGSCEGGEFRRRRRPYEDFSVWSRDSLSGVTLRVAAVASPPPGGQLTHSNGSITGGVAGQLLLTLQRTLGFSYRLELVHGNQPWIAIASRVASGAVDVAGALMISTPQRHRRMLISQPAQQLRVGLALRRPVASSGRGAVLRPFTGSAWAGLAIFLAVLGAALLVAQHVDGTGRHRAADALFAVVGLACQQGVELELSGAAPRIALFSGLAGTFVVYTTYSAVLLSFLAVDIPQLPFRSVAEFRAAADWKYGSLNTALAELSPLAGSRPVTLAPTYPEAVRRFAESDRIVVDATADMMVKHLGCNVSSPRQCPVCVLPGVTTKVYRGLAFRKDFPHYDLFNELLVRLRASGSLQRLIVSEESHTLEDFMCPDSSDVERADRKAMGLADLKQAFSVLPIGVAVGLVILIIECCLKQSRNEVIMNWSIDKRIA